MLQAPTGFGKTLTAAWIIQMALDKGKRVAFVVPALSLIDQTIEAFEAEGIHCVGVMQGIHPRTDRDQPVQVCSVQTLARRRRPEVDVVIIDEACCGLRHGLVGRRRYRNVPQARRGQANALLCG
jgi:DNA repair protein RadD